MNREEFLYWLVSDVVKWGNFPASTHNFTYRDGEFINLKYEPITIHDWNRAKIKPNTKIRIESPEHSEYVQKLAFEAGFKWSASGTNLVKLPLDETYILAVCGLICHCPLGIFDDDGSKEIFIEIPRAETESKTREEIEEELEEENVFERFVAVNREHYKEMPIDTQLVEKVSDAMRNFNAKVLAEKVGSKHDQGKPRYDLIPPHAEAEFVDVLTFGATKYEPNQWRNVPNAKERYTAAAMRHLAAYRMGETNDIESGKHHLAHAMCCLAFITELDRDEDK